MDSNVEEYQFDLDHVNEVDYSVMTPHERLAFAQHIVEQAGVAGNVEPDELIEMAGDMKIKPEKFRKLAGIVSYIRYRTIEQYSRVKAFELSFPRRSVNEDGDLKQAAKETKARRLENMQIYKQVISLLHTSLYVTYAIERMKVLDHALGKIFNEDVADRDKVQYMKTFLEETRKPENAKLEINFNDQSNTQIINIENKMDNIAKQLEGRSAKDILTALHS